MRMHGGERYVEVHGHRLWTRKTGTGGPVTVFVPGGGGIGLDFAPAAARLAAHTTTLLYDRAGTGHSGEVDLPRSAATVVGELRALLAALALPAPYLLVGHSLGGVYVQHYAQRHPEEVAGLVLLDPAHEDFDDYMPEHLKITTWAAQEELGEHGAPGSTPEVTPEFVALAREQITGYVAHWPEPLRGQVIDLHTRPDRLLVGFHEGSNLADVLDELRRGGPRPEVPITVLSAAGIDPFQLEFAGEADLRLQIASTERLAEAVAARGRPGEHLTYPDESHAGLPMRRPDAVADAVTAMIAGLSPRRSV